MINGKKVQLPNEVRNIERLTNNLVLQKMVYGKTSIYQEMFGEKMFFGKCSCRKSEQLMKIPVNYPDNFNKVVAIQSLKATF